MAALRKRAEEDMPDASDESIEEIVLRRRADLVGLHLAAAVRERKEHVTWHEWGETLKRLDRALRRFIRDQPEEVRHHEQLTTMAEAHRLAATLSDLVRTELDARPAVEAATVSEPDTLLGIVFNVSGGRTGLPRFIAGKCERYGLSCEEMAFLDSLLRTPNDFTHAAERQAPNDAALHLDPTKAGFANPAVVERWQKNLKSWREHVAERTGSPHPTGEN